MKTLYYDCFAGISGDMHLGALLDLGVSLDYLIAELQKLGLEGYEVKAEKIKAKGIAATRARVILDDQVSQPGRHFTDITNLIESSLLSDNVKEKAVAVFRILGEAEAAVHGTDLEKIHFHEVGAVDSLIDICGGVICLDHLGVDRILSSPVQLGGGMINCQHGTFPVPAPATAEILKGIAVRTGADDFEMCTPTGAALLKAFVSEFSDTNELMIKKIGYGAGSKEGKLPNVFRVFLCETDVEDDLRHGSAWVIECNIDDMNPELYDQVITDLFVRGADDVWFSPLSMKKNRPAVRLSVLCSDKHLDEVVRQLLTGTTTLGVRRYRVHKDMLPRQFSTLDTPWGEIRIKEALYQGSVIKSKPEYEDIKKAAAESGLPVNEIYMKVLKLMSAREE